MADFYETNILRGGHQFGRALIQANGSIGGHRHVFVKLQGNGKNGLSFPTTGGILVNPFKGAAKAFAGDLVEYTPAIGSEGAKVAILKTYKVAKAAGSSDTDIFIERDGYKHIPFVGDILMAAPSTLSGTGTAVTVTAVEKTKESSKDVWKVTLSATLGTLALGAILVEAVAAGSGKKAVVTNPNCFLPADYDFLYEPSTGSDDYDGARYMLTPCIANEDTKVYIDRVSPLPASVLALNKSRINGWFNL